MYLNVTVMLKEGGYSVIKIPPKLLGELAKSIQDNGFEWVTLQSGTIKVVGFMVTGTQTGERIIVLGEKEPKAIESTEQAQAEGR